MRALFLACPMAILSMGGAMAGGAGWSEARTTWTGPYVGAQAGYSDMDFDLLAALNLHAWEERLPETKVRRSIDGFTGGVYGGYQQQFASGLVLGAEADFNFSGADTASVIRATANGQRLEDDEINAALQEAGLEDADVANARIRDEVKWSAALRLRAGYAAGRFLPYVTGGVAGAKHRLTVESAGGVNERLLNDKLYGWTLGGGFEYAVTEKLVARLEYRYSDYGKDRTLSLGEGGGAANLDNTLTTHDIRAGVGLKF